MLTILSFIRITNNVMWCFFSLKFEKKNYLAFSFTLHITYSLILHTAEKDEMKCFAQI